MNTKECPKQLSHPGQLDYPMQQLPPQSPFGYKPSETAENSSTHSSGGFMDPEDLHPKNFSFNEASVRRGFLRKVYLILMGQLLFTFGVVAVFLFHQPTGEFINRNPSFVLMACIFAVVMVIAMVCYDSLRRQFPTNFICLGIFTVTESIIVGAITVRFKAESVFIAVGITAILCLVLTIFAFQTKYDFTARGGILLTAMVCLLLFGIFALFWRDHIIQIIFASVGALLGCCFLVYDTQMMMGGNHMLAISPEEYIFAALCLYLDVIRLFISVLQLTGNRSQ